MHTNPKGLGCFLLPVLLAMPLTVSAQDDSLKRHTLDEVVVTGLKEEPGDKTSIHIETLSLKQIERQGSFNLSDALTRIPGISQLSTGVAISKPVIRGLYGNRVLVLFSGLRFDNQQWQDEHGLGLSDIGLSKVELIKGPLSVLYGTDAVGGVINIIEEEKAPAGRVITDAGLKFHSNTLGGLVQAGVKANNGKTWYRLRLGYENNADYSDGNGNRVLNSRFDGLYLKGSVGFQKGKWMSDNHYHFSMNRFGFIFNDINDFMEPDARWSRAMEGPHHIVMLNLLSSQNVRQTAKSTLRINGGLQSNYRAEDEGGGQLSLMMHLVTGQFSVKWEKPLNERTELIIANNTSVENNTNYGGRKIIPDAWMAESALSGYIRHRPGRFILEAGAGGGGRFIKTLLTPSVNTPDKDIDPFSQLRGFVNGMLGAGFNPGRSWNLKANASTGTRAPNLSELSANGLHEGIYTYETGDPDMKNEQNLNGDLTANYHGKRFRVSVSGFYNYFFRYIYLDPTSENWFGFPVYRFRQDNAALYGTEVDFRYKPQLATGLELQVAYSQVTGRLANGNYLPWMPAKKLRPGFVYELTYRRMHCYVLGNTDIVFAQEELNPEESRTPGYWLLNAGLGCSMHTGFSLIDLSLTGNNLLNEAYFDHLSRIKTYGLLNIGRNITLQVKFTFNNPLKNKKP